MSPVEGQTRQGGGGLGRQPPRFEAPESANLGVVSGHSIEGYRIDDVIGRGRRSAVYAGEQISLRRAVAIKVLLREFVADEGQVGDFLEAGRESAGLLHPHIVPIYDVVSAGDLHFIVQDRVAGRCLATAVEGGIVLSPEEMIQVGVAAADALGLAHQRGGIHGNLHAGNVFVCHEHLVLLSDFKHFTLLPRSAECSELISKSTPFLPPETLAGDEMSAQSDVFSLGAVLYFAVTGRLPFRSADLRPRLGNPISFPAPDAHAVNPAIPLAVAEGLQSLMAADPQRRPQGMKEVDELLARLLHEFEREDPYVSATGGGQEVSLGEPNRRRYKRLRTEMDVAINVEHTAAYSRDLLLSKLQDFSENGAFVSTPKPLPVGTVVNLEFTLESRAARVHVLGIVRWHSPSSDDPGMGVQFIEVSTDDKRNMREYIDERVTRDMVRAFTRTRLHLAILKLLIANWGRLLSVDTLTHTTGASPAMLRKALPEFERFGLIRIMHRAIKSVRPQSRQVVQALQEAVRDA